MKLTKRRVVNGLAAGGLAAAALAGGGVALASTGAAPAPATPASSAPSWGGCASHFGGMQGRHGLWSGQQPVMQAAAGYLGLSQAQLRTQLQSGKSLADVAKAQGKPVAGLKDTILAAMTSRINANTRLTPDQKAAMLSHLNGRLDAMINMDMDHLPGMGMSGTNWPGGMGTWQ